MALLRRSHSFLWGASASLLFALILIVGAAPAQAQLQPRHQNPPVLPPTSPSSKPVPAGIRSAPPPSGAGPSSSLSASTWTAIGPASLNSGGGLVSGRIAGIAVDPTNSNNIYIAAAGGGVWKTTNGGTSWTPMTDSQQTLAMGAIAIAPTDPQKIYAGTGEANNSADSNHGYGILVSNNGGTTWTLATAGGAFTGNVVGQIAVDPTNENTAYAAVGGYPQNGNYFYNTGIWKTTDGGTTWTNTTASITTYAPLIPWSAVVVDPNTPSIIYAAIGDIYNQGSINGVYRSTNGGTSWSRLTNAPYGTDPNVGRIALAVSPAANQSGKHVLYVAVEDIATSGLYYFERSDNADATTPTFTNLTSGTPNFLGGQGWYDIALNVDSAGVVYAAGVENYNAGGADNILRSTNLGVTWGDISIVNGVEPHTDSHAIAIDSSNRMLIGNDGGIYRYDSTVPSWTDLNSNLNTIQLEGIGLHPTSNSTVVGGSQDNGTEMYSNNLEWTEVAGGDGGLAQFSQTDPSVCYAIHPVGSFGPSAFFQESDGGCEAGTWTAATSGFVNANSNFYAPFYVDPTNGDHLTVGLDRDYESSNDAASWTPVSTPGSGGFNSGGNDVDSVAISPANGPYNQVLYVATGGAFAVSSQIFVSTSDGGAWTEHDLPTCTQDANTSEGCRVNQIVVDPNDPSGDTAFAVTSTLSSGNSHVYRTTNAGVSWTDVSGNLANLPTWSVQIDTDTNHTAYISNDTGVYSSPSPYSTWTAYGTGLPNAQGLNLQLNSSLHLLAVGTHGRGAWEILTPSNTQATPTVTWPTASTITYPQALSASRLTGGSASYNSSPVAGTFAFTSPSTVPNAGTQSESVTFTPTDTTDYATVTGNVTVTVNQKTPTPAWPKPAAITYGTALGSKQLDAFSGVAGTFAYTPAAGTVLTAGTHTLSALFTPTDTVDYTTATVTTTITVNSATPVITWKTPAAITYPAALSSKQLNATANTAGTFVYSPAAGTVLSAGTQTLSVTFTPSDTTDYTSATGTVSLKVNQKTPTPAWPKPAAITYGTALGSKQLDAVSGVAGTFAYTPAAGTVLTAGTHTLSALFTPTDTVDYTTATVTTTITVNPATPVITWKTPAAITYPAALSSKQLDASANTAGTFVYSPAAGTVLTAGSQTLSVTFTPSDTTDYTSATATVSLTVNKKTPTPAWPKPAAITSGTALSSTQLDAFSGVAGTFAYTPPAGTVLSVGTHTLSALFTPTDTTDYTTATVTTTITVNP